MVGVDDVIELVVVFRRLHLFTPYDNKVLVVCVDVSMELRKPSGTDGGAETHDREWLYKWYDFPCFGVQSYVALLPLAKRLLGDVSRCVCGSFEG